MRLALLPLAVLAVSACGPNSQAQSPANATIAGSGPPVESRPPNVPEQKPAWPGQTRAPRRSVNAAFAVKVVAKGLDHPWGLAFLPGGKMLVTERAGRLRVVAADGTLSAPVSGLPAVDARGPGGLLDVALDPNFARNGLIYWTYAAPDADGANGTAAARGKLVDGPNPRVEAAQVIWRQAPTLQSTLHFGGRLAFAPNGDLFITTGERSILPGRAQAQRLDAALGKVIRIKPDGAIPADNPFVGQTDAKPEIWSYGHRNIQAAAINPRTGKLWTVEHGARGGDELNIPQAGKNYGWPVITYGEEYSGKPIGDGLTQKAGMEQPVYYWDPVIAPSGMAFYDAKAFPMWRGSLFIGSMGLTHLVRLTLDGDKVVGEERLLTELGARIRDVRVGPDGAIYVLTDAEDGQLLKLVPEA